VLLNQISRVIVVATGALSSILGAVVLVGWYSHNTLLIQVSPTFVPMQYNTALGFFLSGLGVMTLFFGQLRIARVSGIVVGLVGGLTLIEYVGGLDLGIDQLFMEHYVTTQTSHPGRMAPNTALCFLLTGLALVMLARSVETDLVGQAGGILGALILGLGTVAFTGYVVRLETAYGWGHLTRMAVHTATGFMDLGIAVMALAWINEDRRKRRFPKWSPGAIAIGVMTLTIALWQAIETDVSHRGDEGAITHSLAHHLLLVFGLLLAAALSLSLKLAQTAREQARHVFDINLSLKESEEKFRSMADAASDAVIMLDSDAKVSFWNQAAEKMFGFQRDEIYGREFHRLCVPKDQFPAFEAGYARFRHTGKGQLFGRTVEETAVRKSGSQFPVELSLSAVKIRDEWHTIGIVRDITVRHIHQLEVKRLNKRLELIIKSAAEGIYGTDHDGHCTFINPAALAMLGYDSNEIVGLDQHALFHYAKADGSPYPAKDCPVSLAINDGKSRHITDEVFWRKDGTSFPVDYVCSPLVENGKTMGSVVAFRDNTERKNFEEKLKRSNEDLEQFASAISHDLQAPLNSVTGFLGLMKLKYADTISPDALEYVELAEEGGRQMSSLITDLLEYSRLSTNNESFASVDMTEVCGLCLNMLQTEIAESGASIDISDLSEVTGDRSQLIRLVQNLIGNSLKYRAKDRPPKLQISSREDGEFLRFSLSDNGIGIEPIYFEKIFGVFERVHENMGYEGTGIGLAQCKKIVERHGGRIWVESEPGNGSTFFFTLPASV